MTNDELFSKVKNSLGINNNYLDEVIKPFFDDGITFMLLSGIKEEIIYSDLTVGVLSRYVSDIWNGNEISDLVFKRISQLRLI